MKKILNNIFSNPLAKGSLIMFIGTMMGNFGNYLFHLIMGRMLGPASYGILAALISILYIFSIPASTLGTTMVKFTSMAKAKKNYAQIYSLFSEFSQKFLFVSIALFLLFAFASQRIALFLQIPSQNLVILTGGLFLVSLLPTVNNGILQAFLKFPFLATNSIFGVILKIVLAVGLVSLGFSIGGAMLAIFISTLIVYAISLFPLKFLWRHREENMKIDWARIASYATPVFLTILGLTSLYTTDIILVKHFFAAGEAGLYAALAIMGKIIFYAGSTITLVMFPLVAESYENGGQYKNLLAQSVILVSLISLAITVFYFLFPKIMVETLYGPSYIAVVPYLGFFGIFIFLYSLAYVLANFFLSIHKTKVALFVLLGAFVQIMLISIFHETFFQVIQSSIIASTLLLTLLLVYYFQSEKA